MQTNYFIRGISFRRRNIPYISHDKSYRRIKSNIDIENKTDIGKNKNSNNKQ